MSAIARAFKATRERRPRTRPAAPARGRIVAAVGGIALLLLPWIPSEAEAGAFLPLGPGDWAEYRDDRGGAHRRVQVRPLDSPDSLLYDDLAGLGPLWIRSDESGEQVLARHPAAAEPFLLVDFAAATGTRFAIAVAPCNEGASELAARGGYVSTPAGTFRDVARLDFQNRCRHAGLLRAWFAPGVGLVRYELASVGGPVRYDLVAARIGGRTLPHGERGLVVNAHFPGPLVPGPAQLVLGGGVPTAGTVPDSFPEPLERERPHLTPLWQDAEPSDLLRPLPCPATPICAIWVGKTLSAGLEARNASKMPIAWNSPTRQLFEITVYDQRSVAVSRWSRGRAFAPFPMERTLPPGETLAVSGELELLDDWGLVLPPGPYTIEIEILGAGIRASAPLDLLPAVMPAEGPLSSSFPGTATGSSGP